MSWVTRVERGAWGGGGRGCTAKETVSRFYVSWITDQKLLFEFYNFFWSLSPEYAVHP